MSIKKSHKVVVLMIVMIMAVSLMFGCTPDTTDADDTAAADTEGTQEDVAVVDEEDTGEQAGEDADTEVVDDTVYVYKFAHSMAEDTPRHQSMLYFKEQIEEKTNGRIMVEIYPNGTMGNEAELMDMVKINAIQGTSGSQFAKANPQYLIYNMPFMFESAEEFQFILDSEFETMLADGAIENGYYIPTTGIAGGFRQITNNVRPITSVEDIEGLKIRTPPLDPIIKAMTALKANPTQIAYSETYMALKTGVAEGQENPPSNIVEKKFYEVQEYMSIVNYIISPECFFTSYEWYASLPEDLQVIFDEVAKETMQLRTDTWLASEDEKIEIIGENCEINTVSPEELERFRELCVPVWDEFVAEGSFSQEDLDAIQALLEEYRG